MNKEDIIQGIGRTIKTKYVGGFEHCRIIKVNSDCCIVDFPERRGYFQAGDLMPISTKKIYFNTTNQMWNLSCLMYFEDDYIFQMKKFEQSTSVRLVLSKGYPKENKLYTIEEANKQK